MEDPEEFLLMRARPPFDFTKVDRDIRRAAMASIFKAFNVTEWDERIRLMRRILYSIARYETWQGEFPNLPSGQVQAWGAGVAKHAAALAELMNKPPRMIAPHINPRELLAIAQQARELAGVTARKGRRKRDFTFWSFFLGDLANIFTHLTGKEPRLSRHPTTHEPTGKWFQFVRDVCDLGGIPKTDEAIAAAIKERQDH